MKPITPLAIRDFGNFVFAYFAVTRNFAKDFHFFFFQLTTNSKYDAVATHTQSGYIVESQNKNTTDT